MGAREAATSQAPMPTVWPHGLSRHRMIAAGTCFTAWRCSPSVRLAHSAAPWRRSCRRAPPTCTMRSPRRTPACSPASSCDRHDDDRRSRVKTTPRPTRDRSCIRRRRKSRSINANCGLKLLRERWDGAPLAHRVADKVGGALPYVRLQTRQRSLQRWGQMPSVRPASKHGHRDKEYGARARRSSSRWVDPLADPMPCMCCTRVARTDQRAGSVLVSPGRLRRPCDRKSRGTVATEALGFRLFCRAVPKLAESYF